MNAANAKQYADALDEVNRKVTVGEMTEGEATVWRQRLTAEMGDLGRPGWQKVLIFIVFAVIALILTSCIARGLSH